MIPAENDFNYMSLDPIKAFTIVNIQNVNMSSAYNKLIWIYKIYPSYMRNAMCLNDSLQILEGVWSFKLLRKP